MQMHLHGVKIRLYISSFTTWRWISFFFLGDSGIWELCKLGMQALQFTIAQPSLCSSLSTFTIGINMLPKLSIKFVRVGQCSTLLKHWPGPWDSIDKCCIPAQFLSGGLFTDPIIRRTGGLCHLGCIGQRVRTDLSSVTHMKSSVLAFRNLLSSWHVPKILLQQPPCSSHRYKYLICLAQTF